MNIIVAGGTGQVGLQVLNVLGRPSLQHAPSDSIYALVRRPGQVRPPIQEVVFDYEDGASYDGLFQKLKPSVLIIALGTTMKAAGSVAAFNRVDRDYPIQLIRSFAAHTAHQPSAVIAFVSSLGADKPMGTYLKAKYTVEEAIRETGKRFVIVRPSLLLSHRKEVRVGERVAEKLFAKPYLSFARHFAPKSNAVWKIAPIKVEQVAQALVQATTEVSQVSEKASQVGRVIEGLGFYR